MQLASKYERYRLALPDLKFFAGSKISLHSSSWPTGIAVAMSVSIDSLVFDEEERGPDEQLRLQFEAISHLSTEEKQVVKELLDGMIIKYQSRKWDTKRQAAKG
jgi:hypothetical protein